MMKLKNILHSIISIGLISPALIFGQECQVVKSMENGNYLVIVEGDTLLAITEQVERNILKQQAELEGVKKEIALQDSLIDKYEETVAQYETTLQNLRDYTNELEGVKSDYQELLAKYKKIKTPLITMDAGIGVTGSSVKPALMPGIAWKRYHLWTFLQKNNFGVLVGTSFQIW